MLQELGSDVPECVAMWSRMLLQTPGLIRKFALGEGEDGTIRLRTRGFFNITIEHSDAVMNHDHDAVPAQATQQTHRMMGASTRCMAPGKRFGTSEGKRGLCKN